MPCKEESTDQAFNALNSEPKKCVDVCSFMVATDQVHIHWIFNLPTEQANFSTKKSYDKGNTK
jgi:hypothetical protein